VGVDALGGCSSLKASGAGDGPPERRPGVEFCIPLRGTGVATRIAKECTMTTTIDSAPPELARVTSADHEHILHAGYWQLGFHRPYGRWSMLDAQSRSSGVRDSGYIDPVPDILIGLSTGQSKRDVHAALDRLRAADLIAETETRHMFIGRVRLFGTMVEVVSSSREHGEAYGTVEPDSKWVLIFAGKIEHQSPNPILGDRYVSLTKAGKEVFWWLHRRDNTRRLDHARMGSAIIAAWMQVIAQESVIDATHHEFLEELLNDVLVAWLLCADRMTRGQECALDLLHEALGTTIEKFREEVLAGVDGETMPSLHVTEWAGDETGVRRVQESFRSLSEYSEPDIDNIVLRVRRALGTDSKGEGGTVQDDKALGVKCPPNDAFVAHHFYKIVGWTQEDVAELLGKQRGKPVNQGQVSRWVRQVEKYRRGGGQDPAKVAQALAESDTDVVQPPQISSWDPSHLDQGKRVARRKPRPSDLPEE